MSKKKKKYFYVKHKTMQNTPTAEINSNIGTKHLDESPPNKKFDFSIILTIVSLIITTFVSNWLNSFSQFWAYILLLFSFSIGLAYFVRKIGIWMGRSNFKLINWITKNIFRVILVWILAFIIAIPTIIFTSPYYKDSLLPNNGSIELGPFGNDSAKVSIHYGKRTNDFFFTQETVGKLKQKPISVLNIDGQDILYVHIENDKLFVDAMVFAGYGDAIAIKTFTDITLEMSFSIPIIDNIDISVPLIDQEPSLGIKNGLAQPVIIKNSDYSKKPNGWRIQRSDTALEITNENNIPVLVLEYRSPYEITISGLFVTNIGILKVDNSEGAIFKIANSLSEFGTYKVDRIFINSIFDLFSSERTYTFE